MTRLNHIDGLPVIDAKHPLRLQIKKCDIDKASVKDPSNCAIARAMRREHHVIEARIHLSRAYVRTNKGNWVRYTVPTSARSELIAFDRGGEFEPATFTFSAPQPAKKLGNRRGSKQFKRGNGNKRGPYNMIKNVRNGPA